MTNQIKNFIEEGEKEFEEKFGKDSELSKFLVLKCGKCGHKIKAKEVKYQLYPSNSKLHKYLYQCKNCYNEKK